MWKSQSSLNNDSDAVNSANKRCIDNSVITSGNLVDKSILQDPSQKMMSMASNVTSTPFVHNQQKNYISSTDESPVENVFRAIPNATASTASLSAGSASICKTPARSLGYNSSLMKTPGSGRGSSDRFRRSRGSTYTPSGPRINPFDSQLSVDMLHCPTFSPSVFSTVVSPSQDSGRFWSVDQQAHLFPAHISDDSPWKQEAVSRLDPEAENQTQEAIDLYFSRHSHQITSPDDLLPNSRSVLMSIRSSNMASMGESPDLSNNSVAMHSIVANNVQMESSVAESRILAGKSLFARADVAESSLNGSNSNSLCLPAPAKKLCSQWTQTECTFPSVLPSEVESVLSRYFSFKDDQSSQPKVVLASSISTVISSTQRVVGGGNDEGNNSTLRRKLFAGFNDDSDGSDAQNMTDDASQSVSDEEVENVDLSNIIMPGSLMMTPSAVKKEKSPNKSLSWSLSPVSRKKSIKGPIGSSTPTK